MTRGRHTNKAYVATHQSITDVHEPHPKRTMQDVLEAVLQDPGVELSAHEVMRQELDNATRLDRLIPIHEHLCQLDAKKRYRAAAASSGLSTSDQAALEASSAYGALVAELRRAEASGLKGPEIFRRAVNQASLDDAHDLAAVLHTRVERMVIRYIPRTGKRPVTIAGLVTPAVNISDPTLIAPVRELEAQITRRCDFLAEQAAAEPAAWYQALAGQSPSPNIDFLSLVREIASYRELYNIQDAAILGLEPSHRTTLRRTRYIHLRNRLAPASRRTLHDQTDPVPKSVDQLNRNI
jgi:hypothetical protein